MSGFEILLLILLGISILLNAFQFYRWNAYRSKPAGGHSHTGMMPKVDLDAVEKDRRRRAKEQRKSGG
jgi:hypothetical protein